MIDDIMIYLWQKIWYTVLCMFLFNDDNPNVYGGMVMDNKSFVMFVLADSAAALDLRLDQSPIQCRFS